MFFVDPADSSRLRPERIESSKTNRRLKIMERAFPTAGKSDGAIDSVVCQG